MELDLKFRILNVEMALRLEEPFLMDETKEAIWCCDESKTPGSYGDNEGVTRALFLGSVAANDTDLVEISAVMVALEVFLAMKGKLNDSLFIELGSIVVFNWYANKLMRPWSLQATFAEIERDIEKVGNVVFLMEEKNGNKMTSFLVIARINHEEMFKSWW
ncbi:hypothetical protein J1N35_038203 [Gossypium stocksii]|uniref:RNase H type-1 domain-containing protein n=1 Tax=Gossypium stocksii TaxID=47602 RepID=A0A9D3ZME8_9ROSI|nr:hypothetical protein J1N35_038203 [Gossypium stocksii]